MVYFPIKCDELKAMFSKMFVAAEANRVS